ncbi:hypothetical protein ITP53_15840 [Nonomuraea sp. K274]|uniref:Uncharacterized protein n=1 Tax=Nonomuraea cypriaca TaxID=1187855 RepID=A0A931A6C3_9ACTN|nr:hypothetical protein [Nonomuraea cypriaca]
MNAADAAPAVAAACLAASPRPFILRWFCDGTRLRQLATDHGNGRKTAYRYLHEGDVLAAQAPDLHQALDTARNAGLTEAVEVVAGDLTDAGTPDRAFDGVTAAPDQLWR